MQIPLPSPVTAASAARGVERPASVDRVAVPPTSALLALRGDQITLFLSPFVSRLSLVIPFISLPNPLPIPQNLPTSNNSPLPQSYQDRTSSVPGCPFRDAKTVILMLRLLLFKHHFPTLCIISGLLLYPGLLPKMGCPRDSLPPCLSEDLDRIQ